MAESGRILYGRDSGFQRRWHSCAIHRRPESTGIGDNPVDVFGMSMKPVITQFVLYPKHNQNTGSHTNGKSRNIDDGIASVPNNITQGDLEVVLEHELAIIPNASKKNAILLTG